MGDHGADVCHSVLITCAYYVIKPTNSLPVLRPFFWKTKNKKQKRFLNWLSRTRSHLNDGFHHMTEAAVSERSKTKCADTHQKMYHQSSAQISGARGWTRIEFLTLQKKNKTFHGSHASQNFEGMKEMLGRWYFPVTKVHVIMKKSRRQHGRARLSHKVLSQWTASDAIASCRQFVEHFKHSPLAYSCLQDLQIEIPTSPKRLQQDIKSR